jgi:hypothetical protein
MKSTLRLLVSAAAISSLAIVLFHVQPALAQCSDKVAQVGPVGDPDRRDPHNDRVAQAGPVGDPDRRDPHNDRVAQAGPVGDPDRRDPHNDRVAQSSGCK